MVIYANKIIKKFTFLSINHIFFIFKHSFSLHIFVGPFETIIIITKFGRARLFLMLSLVLIISYVFNLFKLMYCIVFVVLFHFELQFNYFDSKTNTLTLNKTYNKGFISF